MDTQARPTASTAQTVHTTGTTQAVQAVQAQTAQTGREARLRPLWVEEPIGTPRLPDPVRRAAVRAVLIVSVTLIEATVALLATAGKSWLAAPAVLGTVVSTVPATWSVLDVWITRQVWNQRNGVLSSPSSAARALRRERRRERRADRAGARSRPRGQHVARPVSGS
jgi:hypothetical protein